MNVLRVFPIDIDKRGCRHSYTSQHNEQEHNHSPCANIFGFTAGELLPLGILIDYCLLQRKRVRILSLHFVIVAHRQHNCLGFVGGLFALRIQVITNDFPMEFRALSKFTGTSLQNVIVFSEIGLGIGSSLSPSMIRNLPLSKKKLKTVGLFLVESASVRSKQGKRKAATHHKLGPQDKPIPPGILHMYAHADHEAIAVKQFQRIGAALVKLIHYDQSDGVRSRKYVL
jgi:hypothetical protein